MPSIPDDPKILAERLFVHEKLTQLIGTSVRFIRPVQRGNVMVGVGVTGKIVEPLVIEGGEIVACVKLDQIFPSLADYENEIHWREDLHSQFARDIESTS